MNNRKIQIRKYYALEVSLDSPLSISSGQEDMTDMDVLVNGAGKVFVPGTSLAGAMRNYLEQRKNEKGMMGFSADDDGQMSSVFISDLYFTGWPNANDDDKERDNREQSDENEDKKRGKPVISVRDGVALYNGEDKQKDEEDKQIDDEDQWKQVKNKFDMQIVETGAKGILYLNYLVREGEDQKDFERKISDMFCAIQDGTIRIGAHKNRGFGRLKIHKIHEKEFRNDEGNNISIEDWRDFKKNSKDIGLYSKEKETSFEDWKKDITAPQERYVRITVPLKLTGGISIRKYSAEPKEADYKQITCNKKPVIPGSSWSGAIRAGMRDILKSLGMDSRQITNFITEWFGYVKTENTSQSEGENGENAGKDHVKDKIPDAKQSRVVFAESVIGGGDFLSMTRNQINRFDASTIDGALYSEVAYYGGTTKLEIMVKKDDGDKEKNSMDSFLAILDMVIQDIQDGYVPVGGQTAIGRGIFEANGEITYSENVSMENGMSELYSLL